MKAVIERASEMFQDKSYTREINTLEDLKKIQEEEGHRLIISFGGPCFEWEEPRDISILVYDDYLE